jgi:AraC-like DNA-binding protein
MERSTFTDFDAFRATHPHVDGQWLINGGSTWCWSSDALAVGQSSLLRSYLHTGVITEGKESSDVYHFYVPFRNAVWHNFGVGIDYDAVMIVEPGAEYCNITDQEEGFHGFFVPRHLIPLDPATRGDRARYAYVIKGQQRRARRMREVFGTLIAAASENPGFEDSPAARVAEAELRTLLEPLLEIPPAGEKGPSPRGRPRLSRQEIILRAQEVMEFGTDTPLHVSALARAVGVSERSLRNAFNECYQIGPRRYLLLRQLDGVRRDLLAAGPDETTVTKVMSQWGIWEFGRFAGIYHRHFGELPSQTLRRQRPLIRSNPAA